MNYIYLILILVVVATGAWVWCLLKNKKEDEKEILAVAKERDEYEELGKGLAEYNQKLQDRKEQAKQKILELFKIKSKIKNHDVVKALDISRASAERYLDELEKENRLKQAGKVGKYVYYSKI